MVPGAGLEPAHLSAGDFKSPVSTYFTIRAKLSQQIFKEQMLVYDILDLPSTDLVNRIVFYVFA